MWRFISTIIILVGASFAGGSCLSSGDVMPDNFLSFDGSTGYVTVPDNAAFHVGSGNFSVTFWGQLITNDAPPNIISFDGAATQAWYIYGTRPEMVLQDSSGNSRIVQVPVIADPTAWNFYAFTINRAGNGIGYANTVAGTPHSLSNIVGSVDNLGNFVLSYPTQYLSGSLDDVRIYKNIVLTPTQIGIIYAGGVGKKYAVGDAGAASWASNMDSLDAGVVVDEVGGVNGTKTGGVRLASGGVPFGGSGGITGISGMIMFDD